MVEEKLRQKAFVGVTAKGRAGLGFFPRTQYDKAYGKERGQLLQNEVQAGIEEDHYCKMIGLCQQGAWTKWEGIVQRKISWSDCWNANFSSIQFLIKSIYDVLPSPANLHTWEKIDTPNCSLRGKKRPCNIFQVAAPKLWEMDDIFGDTTRSL